MRKAMLGFKGLKLFNKTKGTVFTITDLDYADDICIISDSIEQIQSCLLRIQQEATLVGLRVNFGPKKTELLIIDHSPIQPSAAISLKNASGVEVQQNINILVLLWSVWKMN
jgi:hypothetical protein